MSKNYIQVEDIYFGNLTNAEFISFMERFMALLPLEDDEEGGQIGTDSTENTVLNEYLPC